MKNLLLAFLLMFTVEVAADTSVLFGLWSKHFYDENNEFEEENNLLGIEHGDYFLLTMKNSYRNESWFAGKRYSWETDKGASVGFKVGLITGYEHLWEVGGVTPALIPELRFQGDHLLLACYWPATVVACGFGWTF